VRSIRSGGGKSRLSTQGPQVRESQNAVARCKVKKKFNDGVYRCGPECIIREDPSDMISVRGRETHGELTGEGRLKSGVRTCETWDDENWTEKCHGRHKSGGAYK